MRASLTLFGVIFVILLSNAACSKPQDIVFGPEPIKTIEEQGELFKKLPEDERTLLVAYLALSSVGKALGGDIKPATGRTVAEVLVDAHKWQEKIKAAAVEEKKRTAEAEALKVKILEEQKALMGRISSAAVVTIFNKVILPKDSNAGRFLDMLVLYFAIENKSGKTILQIKGHAIFKDATGDKIGELPIDIDEPIGAGNRLETTSGHGWKLNPYMHNDISKIASKEFRDSEITNLPF